MNVELMPLVGQKIEPFVNQLADLRITVFKEFPYLYEGDLDYEKKYLQTYVNSPNSLVVFAIQDEKVIGATTCIPLADEGPEFQKPFLDSGFDIEKIFYFGESIILNEFRGQKIGHKFFEMREEHANKVVPQLKMTTFCSVIRSQDHPECPLNYKPLNQFWQKMGYTTTKKIISFAWKDKGDTSESVKQLSVWTKPWN